MTKKKKKTFKNQKTKIKKSKQTNPVKSKYRKHERSVLGHQPAGNKVDLQAWLGLEFNKGWGNLSLSMSWFRCPVQASFSTGSPARGKTAAEGPDTMDNRGGWRGREAVSIHIEVSGLD